MNEATHDYIRTTVYIAPFTALIPPNNVHVATLLTPEDDYNTMFYFIAWNGPDKPGIDVEAWRKFNVLQWGVDVDRNFNGVRTRENLYLQDRGAMKQGNFTGISGIPNQDIAMWESMGRSATVPESASAPVTWPWSRSVDSWSKRLVICTMAPVRSGRRNRTAHATISSYEGVVPKTTNWRSLGGGRRSPLQRAGKQPQAAK